jgi:ribosome-binding factor A
MPIMPAKQPSEKEMLTLCGEVHPEDGVDPRALARRERPRKGDRKVRQLCHQVAETLNLVLSGECGDPLLQSLQVMSVDPAPNASQLLVTLGTSLPGEAIDPSEVSACLAKMTGKLRCEVTAAITRKRAPKLVFRVL